MPRRFRSFTTASNGKTDSRARLENGQVRRVLIQAPAHCDIDEVREARLGFGGFDPERPVQRGIEVDRGAFGFGHSRQRNVMTL